MSFEMVTEQDWSNLMNGNTQMPGDKPLVFLGIVGLRELRNSQIGAIAALDDAVKAREAQSEKTRKDEMLSAKAKAAAFEKIDEKYAAEIARCFDAVCNMAAEAMTQSVFWTRPAALQRCKFFDKAEDAQKNVLMRDSLARRVERMAASGLLDLARLAVAIQAEGDRKTAAAMVSVISEELDARAHGMPGPGLTGHDLKALDALMGQVSALDAEARRLIAEAELAAREAALVVGNKRRGHTAEVIATGLRRAAVDQMPRQ